MSIQCWTSPLFLIAILPIAALGQDGQDHISAVYEENTWTFSAGLGSSEAWNLMGISKELHVKDHTSVFLTYGLGEMILGTWISFYGNREGGGVVASAVAGSGLQFVLTYRWELERSNYLALGGT